MDAIIASLPHITKNTALGSREHLDNEHSLLRMKHIFRFLEGAIADGRPVETVVLVSAPAILRRDLSKDTISGAPLINFVVNEYSRLGYDTLAWRTVSAEAFGDPCSCDRVLIVASWSGDARDIILGENGLVDCVGCPLGVDLCHVCYQKKLSTRASNAGIALSYDTAANALSGASVDTLCSLTSSGRRYCVLLPAGDDRKPQRFGLLSLDQAHALLGLPPDYLNNALLLDSGAAWKALGNAIHGKMAEFIVDRLVHAHCNRYMRQKDLESEISVAAREGVIHPWASTHSGNNIAAEVETVPSAGWCSRHEGVFGVRAGTHPEVRLFVPLSKF